MTPVEDRGCRLPGVASRGDSGVDRCRFRGSFGVTPVEDRGCRLAGVDSRGDSGGDPRGDSRGDSGILE